MKPEVIMASQDRWSFHDRGINEARLPAGTMIMMRW
jgi:hypothetical protein